MKQFFYGLVFIFTLLVFSCTPKNNAIENTSTDVISITSDTTVVDSTAIDTLK